MADGTERSTSIHSSGADAENQLRPRSAEAYANLGFVLAQHGEPEESARFLAAAVRLNPGLADRDPRLRPFLESATAQPGG